MEAKRRPARQPRRVRQTNVHKHGVQPALPARASRRPSAVRRAAHAVAASRVALARNRFGAQVISHAGARDAGPGARAARRSHCVRQTPVHGQGASTALLPLCAVSPARRRAVAARRRGFVNAAPRRLLPVWCPRRAATIRTRSRGQARGRGVPAGLPCTCIAASPALLVLFAAGAAPAYDSNTQSWPGAGGHRYGFNWFWPCGPLCAAGSPTER